MKSLLCQVLSLSLIFSPSFLHGAGAVEAEKATVGGADHLMESDLELELLEAIFRLLQKQGMPARTENLDPILNEYDLLDESYQKLLDPYFEQAIQKMRILRRGKVFVFSFEGEKVVVSHVDFERARFKVNGFWVDGEDIGKFSDLLVALTPVEAAIFSLFPKAYAASPMLLGLAGLFTLFGVSSANTSTKSSGTGKKKCGQGTRFLTGLFVRGSMFRAMCGGTSSKKRKAEDRTSCRAIKSFVRRCDHDGDLDEIRNRDAEQIKALEYFVRNKKVPPNCTLSKSYLLEKTQEDFSECLNVVRKAKGDVKSTRKASMSNWRAVR